MTETEERSEGKGELRAYLRSNMFDGDEAGTVTMRTGALLDDVVDLVAEFIRGETADEPAQTLTFAEVLQHFGLTEVALPPSDEKDGDGQRDD